MPASLVADLHPHAGGLEDQRALQLALELSMLGLNPNDEDSGIQSQVQQNGLNSSPTFEQMDEAQRLKKGANMTECVPVPSSEHVAEIVGRQGCKIKALRAKTNTYIKTPVRGEEPVFVVTGRREDVASAKREIMSAAEHFSQIRASRRSQAGGGGVGGVTPPVGGGTGGPPSPSTTPGQVTVQVRVPYRVVGLVVGPKGATIKRIQQQTHTYIVTPSRDKEPVFEVTGAPENAESARREIEAHIALRTGGAGGGPGGVPGMGGEGAPSNNMNNVMGVGGAGVVASEDVLNQLNDFHSNGVDTSIHHLSNHHQQHNNHHSNHHHHHPGNLDLSNDLYSSMYNKTRTPPTGSGSNHSAFSAYNSNNLHQVASHHHHSNSSVFTFPPAAPPPTRHHGNNHSPLVASLNTNGFSSNGYGFYDNEDDPLTSPAGFPHHHSAGATDPASLSIWSDVTGHDQPMNGSGGGMLPVFTTGNNLPLRGSTGGGYGMPTTPRLSPVLTDSSSSVGSGGFGHHGNLRRIGSDPMTTIHGGGASLSNGSGSPTLSSNSSSSSASGGSFGGAVSMASLSESSSSSSPTDSAGSNGLSSALSAILRPPPAAHAPGPASRGRPHCLVCGDAEVQAALVPCGHNLFCLDCATRVLERPDPAERRCPVCAQPPSQAIRILS